MRRRALLASLAAGTVGLAGCSTLGGDGTDTVTPADVPDRSPTPTDRRSTTNPSRLAGTDQAPDSRTSVVELETGPRTYAVSPTGLYTADRAQVALWFDRTATAEHPPRVRGLLENTNDFQNTFRIDRIPGIGQVYSRQPDGYDHEARLHLAPTEHNPLAETVPDFTRDESGYWRVDDVGPWMSETYRMDPGERVALEYVLVGEPGMPGRPTGTYEFRGDEERLRVAVWDTTSPGPAGDSRFSGRAVPSFEGETTVSWYHEADPGTVAFVRPSTERVELDGRVDFEAVNHSHEALQCGHWNLHKLVDGEWYHVGPLMHTADCRALAPGGRKRWSLRAFNGEAVDCDCPGYGSGGFTRGYLGGGTYAAVAGYGHPHDRSAALVELVGDPVSLEPTADASVEREGDLVRVRTDRFDDDDHLSDSTIELRRADSADSRVIAEQLMADSEFLARSRGLRNALAVVSAAVDRVVVRTDEHAVDGVFESDGTVTISFRGQAYEVRRIEN